MAKTKDNIGAAKTIFGCFLATMAILMLAGIANAQPPRNKILGDISVSGKDSCQSVQIGLNFPVRYISHIPLKDGKELLIKIKPIVTGQQETIALGTREAYALTEAMSSLRDVVYEGDIEDGPFLSLHFSQQVEFEVTQGTDYRSVRVMFHSPGPSSCGGVTDAP